MHKNAKPLFDLPSLLENFENGKSKEIEKIGSAKSFLQSYIEEVKNILSFLISEYVNDCYFRGDAVGAEKMLLYGIRISPKNPLNWLAVATHKALHCDDLDGFRKYLRKALSISKKEGSFYIHCNIHAISIFTEFKHFDEANSAINRILLYMPKNLREDSGYSIEYMASLKGIGLDDDLIDDYLRKFSNQPN